MPSSHLVAALQALLVTFLWSTSWVLIKIGLQDIPALTFAGLRYGLAFLVLLPLALRSGALARLRAPDWRALAALGLVLYAVTQGAQFLALSHLPAQTASLLMSFSPVAVALLGASFLREPLTARQAAGIGLFLGGTLLYFLPLEPAPGLLAGVLVALVGVVANAVASVLGRAVNRSERIGPLAVTVGSMGIGSAALLTAGVVTQGLPALDARGWSIVLWLAVVNTAFAFTLWNHTLRTLTATESSVLNNTMLLQIAVLAWLFLGEALSPKEILAFAVAAAGILVVQLRPGLTRFRSRGAPPAPGTEADRPVPDPGRKGR